MVCKDGGACREVDTAALREKIVSYGGIVDRSDVIK
jgi:hypothetical protein